MPLNVVASPLPRAVVTVCTLLSFGAACASGGRSAQSPSGDPGMVTAKDIEHNPGTPIEKLLESKVPGIAVTRTADGNIAIEIRGSSSFYSGTTPLYVIDGMAMEAGRGGALMGVNPYDIDTIKVLKNPADIALYGVRGANGVILITTKRPSKRTP
jgi:TonB-dependent SusC/RagA subfamily outer membrane receptor